MNKKIVIGICIGTFISIIIAILGIKIYSFINEMYFEKDKTEFELQLTEWISKVADDISLSYINGDEDKYNNSACIVINDSKYTGSVYVTKTDNQYEPYNYEIWMSDGTFYGHYKNNKIDVQKSAKIATENCYLK